MSQEQRQLDRALVEKLMAGKQDAFDELYHKYSKRVYGFCFGFLRCKEDAEGIVQDVFIKVWENRNKLRPDLSFSWFLFTIAKNTVLNFLNHRKYEHDYAKMTILTHKDSENSTEEEIYYRDASYQIDQAVAKLPARRREVFVLSRKEGLSYQEIADQLNISVKTVEAQVSQALKQIRQELRKSSLILANFIMLLNLLDFFYV